jgi:integrase
MGALRTKMELKLRARGVSERTAHHYLRAVAGLARHYGRAPDTLTIEDVEAYLVHLRHGQHLAWESLGPVVSGLRFFYYVTLGRPRAHFAIPAPPPSRKQPDVLSRQEVVRLLAQARTRRDHILLMTTYAAGLRVSEVVALQVAHLDGERKVIRIEQGKGRSDRYALLSERLLAELRAYWRVCRPTPWLFPGQRPGRALPICGSGGSTSTSRRSSSSTAGRDCGRRSARRAARSGSSSGARSIMPTSGLCRVRPAEPCGTGTSC